MSLCYVIYSSTPAWILNDDEMEELLSTARRENQNHGVTGMLLCFSDMYVQLIEGPKEEIAQLYYNIRNDKRHYQVTTLKEGELVERFFNDWSMGFNKDDRSVEDNRKSFDISDLDSIKLLKILDWDMS